MSKLNVFDAINKLVGNSVRIYRGPIHRVYADDFELVRGRPLYKKKDVIVKKHASFYLCDGDNNKFQNMDYGVILPTQNEARNLCDDAVNKNKTLLINILNGRIQDPKEAQRLVDGIVEESDYLYYIPNELVYSHDISKKEFKQFVKQIEDHNNQNKR